MRSDVTANAIAENLFAEKTLQHSQKRLALFVSDIIERAVGFRFRCDALLDRVRSRTRVALHRGLLGDPGAPGRIARHTSSQPDFPLRVEMRRAFAAHPRREPFVEPEIIPPGHGHQIAKPLVRHFVREYLVDNLFRFRRRVFRIKQKRRLVISDSAPVFHRAAETTRQSDLVEFRQWIRHAEIIVVVSKNLRCYFERVAAEFCFALRCDHTNLRGSTSRFDEIKLARDEDIQITRHRRRGGEADFFPAGYFFLALDRHVRDRQPILRDDRRQLKARAKYWFIPARKKTTSISRFKLCPEHDFFLPTRLLLIMHVKKSLSLLVDFPGETERQRVISGRKFATRNPSGGGLRRQCENEQFPFLVDIDCRLRQWFAIERRLTDFQFERIEHQLTNRLPHAQPYRFRTAERQLLDVRNNPNGVICRNDLFRQFSRGVLKTEWIFCSHDTGQGNDK